MRHAESAAQYGRARVTPGVVLAELRRHTFAVPSTVDEEGRPSPATRAPLVVPLSRRFLRFLPPATIQIRGRAELLDWSDETGTAAFRSFWVGRRILDAYAASRRRGDTRVCFLKITPEPLVRTYMVGYGIWELRNRMEAGAASVVIG